MGNSKIIVLDTHILVWWVASPEKLSQKALQLIEKTIKNGTVLISSISVWEIYMLVKKGRLKLTMGTDSWLEKVESISHLEFVPVDNKTAARSVNLPSKIHEDPADRMIIATARERGAVLLTSDTRMRKYPHIQTVW